MGEPILDATGILARAEAALEGVTEGPWEVDEVATGGYNPHYGVRQAIDRYRIVVHATSDYEGYGNGSTKADARFIAAARQLVPVLMSALRESHQSILSLATQLADRVDDGQGEVRVEMRDCPDCGLFSASPHRQHPLTDEQRAEAAKKAEQRWANARISEELSPLIRVPRLTSENIRPKHEALLDGPSIAFAHARIDEMQVQVAQMLADLANETDPTKRSVVPARDISVALRKIKLGDERARGRMA